MVLIESQLSDEEITGIEEPNPSSSPSSLPEITTAKLVGGDDSDGFETASELEVSDNDESDTKEDAITDDGSKLEKALEDANEAKVVGNKLFGNGLYEEALSKYELALQFTREFPESLELRSICHSNRATCYLKMSLYGKTVPKTAENFRALCTSLAKSKNLNF